MKDLSSAIRDRGSSIRNNSDRAAHVWENRNYSGRWVPPAAETSSSAHERPAVVPPHAGQGPLTNWRHRASRRTDSGISRPRGPRADNRKALASAPARGPRSGGQLPPSCGPMADFRLRRAAADVRRHSPAWGPDKTCERWETGRGCRPCALWACGDAECPWAVPRHVRGARDRYAPAVCPSRALTTLRRHLATRTPNAAPERPLPACGRLAALNQLGQSRWSRWARRPERVGNRSSSRPLGVVASAVVHGSIVCALLFGTGCRAPATLIERGRGARGHRVEDGRADRPAPPAEPS
ncbi:peptidase inhibitor family I36 protein [Streptomyces cyslabdanicus]|uniref:peptidase inhibitor family I36 protein n=1 Tax=Streptomyces cyslabdanicus TaxID=1470456 RepID=UPI004043D337